MWKSTASSWVRFILRNRLGPYSPMEPIVVERMLSALKVDSTDVLFDLGCGDGRVLVTAAKLGCRSVGVELDKNLASLAQENIRKANASHLAEVRCQNALTTDISEATAVTLYLSEHGNKALLPLLRCISRFLFFPPLFSVCLFLQSSDGA